MRVDSLGYHRRQAIGFILHFVIFVSARHMPHCNRTFTSIQRLINSNTSMLIARMASRSHGWNTAPDSSSQKLCVLRVPYPWHLLTATLVPWTIFDRCLACSGTTSKSLPLLTYDTSIIHKSILPAEDFPHRQRTNKLCCDTCARYGAVRTSGRHLVRFLVECHNPPQ